ncbi:DUF4292 domain-containing protein [Algoriphagus limi]|uniref:DUF4292 domain-containing protein n=1 Tax=Algoriphagus limi TaxID=2975273 RepID=A0ABT2G4A8_9BACT|nr:DUF4292 domain-containing protein [Algoriphagus limi]MCS5490095.1 DUF4292 domain-containing protein [Algoriphagus limi]
MNKFLAYFLLLGGLIFLNACAKKTIPYSSNSRMEGFNPSYPQYQYLTARAKVVIEEGSGKITRGTLNLRSKKDSVLWFSISPGLGMEAVRGLITQEKIQIKDRIGNEDVNLTFEEFKNYYGLDLSLDLFQNILWANPPFVFDYSDRLVKVKSSYELTQVRNQVRYFSKIGTENAKVNELASNSLDDRGSLLASFADYQDVEGQPFPSETLYQFVYQLGKEKQNTIVHLDWTGITLQSESLNFPFRF